MCLIGGVVVVDQFTLRLPQALYLLTHWHAGPTSLTQIITRE